MDRSSQVILNPGYSGAAERPRQASLRERWSAIVETTKPGITRLVTITAGVGFAMVALNRSDWSLAQLLLTSVGVIFGTAITSSGANALNMWYEREPDALMRRTHGRPLPQGVLHPRTVLLVGLGCTIVGVLLLLTLAGAAAALVGLTCVAVYVLAYTPLKPRTTWNTLVGTIPGALPPIIGAAAASGASGLSGVLHPIGLILFGIMTLWQIPHFLAIAWMYREDYAAGGHRMLPVVDPTGSKTAFVMILTTVLLIPLTLAPAMLGRDEQLSIASLWTGGPGTVGLPYAGIALAGGIGLLALTMRFALRRDRTTAKALFLGSIMHLPLLLLALVAEAAARVFLAP